MNASTGSLSEMINSSIVVLTKPSVATFEQYERRGTLQTALIYVGVAAAVAAVVAFLFGIFGGLGIAVSSALSAFIGVFVNFLVFSGVTYYVGRMQGGSGSFDEVAYTFSLFMAPISVIVNILTVLLTITLVGICLLPFLAIAAVVAYVYFGYLAVQSSMNLTDRTKVFITLGAAALATIIVNALVTTILT